MAEFLDLVVGAGVLAVELVAGKAENDELIWVFGLHVLVEGFEALKLRSEAAFGGGVDGEDYLQGSLLVIQLGGKGVIAGSVDIPSPCAD